MKRKLSNLWISLQAIAALSVIGAVKLWAPVCGKMLELTSGKEVPMKCYYTGQAAMAVATLLACTAVIALLEKGKYKKYMLIILIGAVILFSLFGSWIGVCASAEMRCQITAMWGKGAAVVMMLTSVVELLSGKEGQIPD